MTELSMKLNISPSDAIIVGERLHFIEKVTTNYITLVAQGPASEPTSFTHQEMRKLIAEGHFSYARSYFSDKDAARRARAGRSLLSDLPSKSQLHAFYWEAWCMIMLQEEAAGRFNRSSERWQEFAPALHELVIAKLKEGILKGTPIENEDFDLFKKIPSRATALGRLEEWLRTKDPLNFVKKSTTCGLNAKCVHPEVEAIIHREIKNYLHPNRIFPAQVHQAVNAEIRRLNTVRDMTADAILPRVSLSTVRRRIKDLDQFEVEASRHGVAYAKNKLAAHGGGLGQLAPLQRIEMDEWEIDLMSIFQNAKIDITQPNLRDVVLGRYWVCAAIDASTRSVLGLKLSEQNSVANAKAVLWMAMRDKSEIASKLGCESPWLQHGHLHHVVVDNGPAFVNQDLKAALSDLKIDYTVLPGGIPKLRGRIERLFGTFATQLMPHLTGRVFSNPQERGDYPSEKLAVHTAASLTELLLRYTVDVYHNAEHRSLEHASPNTTWKRLINQYGWSPSASSHTLRHILGLKLNRKSGRHGVLVNGVNYHSDRLANHFQKFGPQNLKVSIDPEDLGHVSAWLELGDETGWCSLRAQQRGLEGISFVSWERSVFELRQANRATTNLTQSIVDRAIAAIKEKDASQRALRQVGPFNHTADEIERAQRETFWGLSLGESPQSITDNDVISQDQKVSLLADEIRSGMRELPAEKAVISEASTDHNQEWLFSDELEQSDAENKSTTNQTTKSFIGKENSNE